jgi:hypothetical protein
VNASKTSDLGKYIYQSKFLHTLAKDILNLPTMSSYWQLFFTGTVSVGTSTNSLPRNCFRKVLGIGYAEINTIYVAKLK